MNSRDFVFWINGYLELSGPEAKVSAKQVKVIREHLGLVFAHDPQFQAATPEKAPVKPSSDRVRPPVSPRVGRGRLIC